MQSIQYTKKIPLVIDRTPEVIDDETIGVEIHYEDIQIDGCWNGKSKESFNGIRISSNTICIDDYDVCS